MATECNPRWVAWSAHYWFFEAAPMEWSLFGPDIIANLIADTIFAVLVVVVAIVLGNVAWRRKVRRFFGMTPGRGRLPVYLSNIWVKRAGTIGTGPITVGYHGTAITELEYKYALAFAATVESKPFYRALRAIDSAELLTTVDPIVCHIQTSPTVDDFGDGGAINDLVGSGTTIIVGAAIYNVLTKHLMAAVPSRFEFIRRESDGERGIKVSNFRGNESKEFWRYEDSTNRSSGEKHPFNKEYFIVERLEWTRGQGKDERSSTIFICAGTCSAATAAALRVLADWPALAKRFRGREFGLLREIHLDATEELEGSTREKEPPDQDPMAEPFSYDKKR